jgi:hypothetical protein
MVQQGQTIELPAPPSTSEEPLGRELPQGILCGTRANIYNLRADGFDVDDDNDSAPENIPENTAGTIQLMDCKGQERKKDGFCRRAMAPP